MTQKYDKEGVRALLTGRCGKICGLSFLLPNGLTHSIAASYHTEAMIRVQNENDTLGRHMYGSLERMIPPLLFKGQFIENRFFSSLPTKRTPTAWQLQCFKKYVFGLKLVFDVQNQIQATQLLVSFCDSRIHIPPFIFLLERIDELPPRLTMLLALNSHRYPVCIPTLWNLTVINIVDLSWKMTSKGACKDVLSYEHARVARPFCLKMI